MKVARRKVWLVALLMGVLHLSLWWVVGEAMLTLHPLEKFVSLKSPDEFSFGLFVWGVLVPILWFFYLSSPEWWKRTLLSLSTSGNIKGNITRVIETPAFPGLALLLATLAGIEYLKVYVPSEIASGRISFWFLEWWSKAIISVMLTVTYYIIAVFVLNTLLKTARFYQFFKDENHVEKIHRFHIDQCGGFSPISHLAVRLSSLAILLGGWAVWYTYLPWFAGGRPNFSPAVIFVYVLYSLLAPSILLVIVWPVHIAMMRYKVRRREEVTKRMEELFTLLSASPALLENEAEYERTLEEFRRLKFVDEELKSLPEWPIDSYRLRKFMGVASLPGGAGLISYVIDFLNLSSKFGDFLLRSHTR